MKLAINRCACQRSWSVSIDDDHGGTRVTPEKCCRRWTTMHEWTFTADQWRELANLAAEAEEQSDV